MARSKGKARYFRLDRRERSAIEHALDRGVSCRSIAREIQIQVALLLQRVQV